MCRHAMASLYNGGYLSLTNTDESQVPIMFLSLDILLMKLEPLKPLPHLPARSKTIPKGLLLPEVNAELDADYIYLCDISEVPDQQDVQIGRAHV